MTYLLWRLHRSEVVVAGGGLVSLLAALFIIPGVHERVVADVLIYATIIVPLLFGLFWSSPLLAKEFEDGTQGLVLTQGVTRRHWLSSNVMSVLLVAAVWSAVLTAVITSWSLSEISLRLPRISNGPFDVQGIVPVAYTLFAVALGIAVGTMFRRILPAMAMTFAIFVALRIVVAVVLRPHYMSPLSRLASASLPSPSDGVPAGSSILSVVPHGSHLVQIVYQPPGRFWAFQGIEAGIFLLLAVAAVAFAYRMVLTRDA